ncbi:MAG: hypothetical protein JSR37_09600 [Verrucomicrobia bacterium]|nr:hypothetical protein [Verrucomicrobiota bacterium]MBS0636516.1 hypothetical protein [Verrucomicrobiota bacterium]
MIVKLIKTIFQKPTTVTETSVDPKIEKIVRDLQRKGFLLPISKELTLEAFHATLPELKALGFKATFNFHKGEKGLEFLLFSSEGECTSHPVDDPYFHLKPSYIPLSQLQDISGWLHNHGAARAPLLSLETIEKKLEGLMKSCPHGAYMLHTHNKTLTLSRLSPLGTIEHMIIDLQKQIGSYSIENEGIATRTQFKKRLSQMGTPLRLVS